MSYLLYTLFTYIQLSLISSNVYESEYILAKIPSLQLHVGHHKQTLTSLANKRWINHNLNYDEACQRLQTLHAANFASCIIAILHDDGGQPAAKSCNHCFES